MTGAEQIPAAPTAGTPSASVLMPVAAVHSALFDLLPEAYIALDQRYVILAVNTRFEILTGRNRADIVGRSIFELGPTAQQLNWTARQGWLVSLFDSLLPNQLVRSPEFREELALEADQGGTGVRVWVMEATLVRPDEGESDIILARLQDVTEPALARERVQRERAQLRSQAHLRARLVQEAQEAVRHEKEQLEEALAFARIGAWRLDLSTGDMTCTQQCKTNIGLPVDSVLSEALFFDELIDPRDRAAVREAMSEALKQRTFFEAECRTRWLDGSEHWILMRGNLRHDEHAFPKTLHGLTLDITERKLGELRRESAIVAEKEARQLSDARVVAMDGFVSSVSHEIRSPLNAILSWSQLLRRASGAQVHKASDVIERNARQLSFMVDDLLDTGAMVNGKLTVRKEPVDLGALAASAVEDLRHDIEAKGLLIDDARIESCLVIGDKNRLRQIVYNLLSNALKFTREGGLAIRVERTDQDKVVLAIKDSGIGIDDETLPRIFERFQQGATEGGGRVGGLGLGLWLVKNLAELHDGSVCVQSEGLGCGATFEVTLPKAVPG